MSIALKRFTIASLVIALSLGLSLLLGACAGSQTNSSNDRASQNRAYMSQLNTGLDELRLELDDFSDLAATGDVVAMRTAADDARSTVEGLKALSVPEDMKPISEEYLAGCNDLQQALDAYVQLYGESQANSLSADAFNDRLSTVQSLYNQGLEHLQQGDDLAKNLQ